MLIDGDNAQASLLGEMLAEASKYGLVTVRRIYGDWTTPNMGGWKDALNIHAIQPIQQFRYTVGKNATDSAMIIDAMDILYTVRVDGFCIVSSDSDYTRLATRESAKKACSSWVSAKSSLRVLLSTPAIFSSMRKIFPNQCLRRRLNRRHSTKPLLSSPKPSSSSVSEDKTENLSRIAALQTGF